MKPKMVWIILGIVAALAVLAWLLLKKGGSRGGFGRSGSFRSPGGYGAPGPAPGSAGGAQLVAPVTLPAEPNAD